MKIALVHDYLNEWGGAELVLRKLADMYPEAPIYTAFAVSESSAEKAFKDRKIITSWMQQIPFYNKLYSPLRFLIPWIWSSFNLSEYDLVITSASWYVTKGLGKKEICYCHTPPRWLYGYETSINWQKWWIVRVYALIVGHFLRLYDFKQAQKVTQFVANSENVKKRIEKFYRREAVVVSPPISPPSIPPLTLSGGKKDYFLMVTRVVGGKGIEMAIEAAKKYKFNLKIAGEKAGFSRFENSEYFIGRVSDEEKYKLMTGAKAFLALSKDEDFGITPVEAQMCGTPVIAYNGGGYKESVINNKTGVLFDDYSVEGLGRAIKRFNNLKFEIRNLKSNSKRFNDQNFEKKFRKIVDNYAGTT